MGKTITILSGFLPDDKSLLWSDATIITEIETGGEDTNGFKNNETLGIAKTIYGNICMFRGSKDSTTLDKMVVLHMSDDCKDISTLLRELAEAIENG